MNRKQDLGMRGEMLAAAYLQSQGWQVLAHNVRTPYGEIDLVAEQDGLTIFVEVKTRRSARYGRPETAVDARKLAHMRDSAAHYAAEHGLETWRLDVLAIELPPGQPPRFTHFENVQP